MLPRIAMILDTAGVAVRVLSGPARAGEPFALVAEENSRGKAGRFLEAVMRDGAAAAWEFAVPDAGVPRMLSFSGVAFAGGLAVIGDDLPGSLDEISRLNNELVNSQRELARNNAALERANGELARFAEVVSHDLRAPLRNIRQLIGLFQQKAPHLLDERASLWFEHIVANAARMQKRIEDTLAYAALGGPAVAFEPVSLNEVADSFATEGLVRADLPVVAGVRSQIELVFQNLIENAFRYRSAAPPRVEISAEPAGSRWRLAVRDNGRGIAVNHRDRIFEMFFRVGEDSPGTGIGLATCRQIVTRHGGEIWVDSEPGAGSTFYFTLPAVSS